MEYGSLAAILLLFDWRLLGLVGFSSLTCPLWFSGNYLYLDGGSLLRITMKTVSNHIKNIFNKVQVTDRTQAIIKARDAGMGKSEFNKINVPSRHPKYVSYSNYNGNHSKDRHISTDFKSASWSSTIILFT